MNLIEYGRNGMSLFHDSLFADVTFDAGFPKWLHSLSRVERNSAFSNARDMSNNQVRGIDNSLEKIEGKSLRRDRHAIEWHRKFILAVSCLVLFFVGASLGALVKKGGIGLPIVLALMVFILYYIISIVGEQMVKSGTFSPMLGMWLSTIVLVPGAAILTAYAVRGGRSFLNKKFSIN